MPACAKRLMSSAQTTSSLASERHTRCDSQPLSADPVLSTADGNGWEKPQKLVENPRSRPAAGCTSGQGRELRGQGRGGPGAKESRAQRGQVHGERCTFQAVPGQIPRALAALGSMAQAFVPTRRGSALLLFNKYFP